MGTVGLGSADLTLLCSGFQCVSVVWPETRMGSFGSLSEWIGPRPVLAYFVFT